MIEPVYQLQYVGYFQCTSTPSTIRLHTACVGGLARLPSYEAQPHASSTQRPAHSVPRSCTSAQDSSWRSACLDVPLPALSNSSPCLAPPAPRPPSTVPDSC